MVIFNFLKINKNFHKDSRWATEKLVYGMGKDDTEVTFGKLLEINSHSMFNHHFHFVFTKPAQDEQEAGPSEKEDEVSDTMYLSGIPW